MKWDYTEGLGHDGKESREGAGNNPDTIFEQGTKTKTKMNLKLTGLLESKVVAGAASKVKTKDT